MNIQEYYKEFKQTVSTNIDKSLSKAATYYQLFTKNRCFTEDDAVWVNILADRPECCIYENALMVYQEAIANMLMGLYQPAFMGLRYFLERTLVGINFSSNELELRTWLSGSRDTYWTELIGLEDEDKADCDTNKGIFSSKFTNAFFLDFVKVRKTFRKLTKDVYRECSEYVHGNPGAINEIGHKIEYNEDLAMKWNDLADTVARCILYCYMMRYWNGLNNDQKIKVIERLREEFSTTEVIKDYLNL